MVIVPMLTFPFPSGLSRRYLSAALLQQDVVLLGIAQASSVCCCNCIMAAAFSNGICILPREFCRTDQRNFLSFVAVLCLLALCQSVARLCCIRRFGHLMSDAFTSDLELSASDLVLSASDSTTVLSAACPCVPVPF